MSCIFTAKSSAWSILCPRHQWLSSIGSIATTEQQSLCCSKHQEKLFLSQSHCGPNSIPNLRINLVANELICASLTMCSFLCKMLVFHFPNVPIQHRDPSNCKHLVAVKWCQEFHRCLTKSSATTKWIGLCSESFVKTNKTNCRVHLKQIFWNNDTCWTQNPICSYVYALLIGKHKDFGS